jgi:hypothetical protein
MSLSCCDTLIPAFFCLAMNIGLIVLSTVNNVRAQRALKEARELADRAQSLSNVVRRIMREER